MDVVLYSYPAILLGALSNAPLAAMVGVCHLQLVWPGAAPWHGPRLGEPILDICVLNARPFSLTARSKKRCVAQKISILYTEFHVKNGQTWEYKKNST